MSRPSGIPASKWKAKVDPLFLKIATIYKENREAVEALGPGKPPELYQQIDVHFRQRLAKIKREIKSKYKSDDILPSVICLGAQNEGEMLFAYYCYLRTGKPLWKLAQEDWDGDPKASEQLIRLRKDWADLANGKRIKPLKIKLDHWDIFEIGLPVGLDKLTSIELAECFDDVCPCGKSHDADTLKKLRAKIKRERERLGAFKQVDSKFARNVLSHYSENEAAIGLDYPVMFTVREVVGGNGYWAGVTLSGRAIIRQEGVCNWQVYGVQPSAVTDCGNTPSGAFQRFQERWKAVLFDFARDAADFDSFKSKVMGFYARRNLDAERRWAKAFQEMRKGRKVEPPFAEIPKESPDKRPAGVSILPLR